MYEMTGRVRFSEVDSGGQLSVSALINYLQDCCTFHSEDCGYPLEMMQAARRGWFLMTWQIKIRALPRMGEEILVKTAPASYQGLLAERWFSVESKAGALLAEANSFWVLMDLSAQKPVRISDDMKTAYGPCVEKTGAWMGRKLTVPKEEEEPEEIGSFTVGPLDVDTNSHMNNERYVTAVLSLLPKEQRMREIRIEYRNQARAGETVRVLKSGGLYMLAAAEGTVYAALELL